MLELNKIYQGDCIDVMKQMDENSVDAIITDPPYGLEFMGKEWDKFNAKISSTANDTGSFASQRGNVLPFGGGGNRVVFHKGIEASNSFQQFCFQWATQALRVLKPGGFLLSFGGTRTYHRMVTGIEDAGFEIRDTIMWLYGSGFPKSLNIGKQIDKLQGNEREIIGKVSRDYPDSDKWGINRNPNINNKFLGGRTVRKDLDEKGMKIIEKGNSEWEGWGTALKPACEPIVVARKPLSEKNVALNVLKWGTGGINIDESRIGIEGGTKHNIGEKEYNNEIYGKGLYKDFGEIVHGLGRFPANLILDEEAAKMLDEQSGISESSDATRHNNQSITTGKLIYGKFNDKDTTGYSDKGGASRFFYTAKSSKSERNEGLDEFEEQVSGSMQANIGEVMQLGGASLKGEPKQIQPKKNIHPTVKPIDLMEYLIKLVTKENAIVLDPFLGSGTTAIACRKLSRQFIGIEKEQEYIKIAEARLKTYMEQKKLSEVLTI